MNGKPNADGNEQPLTLTFSPYEGERETVSLVSEGSRGLAFRAVRPELFRA